MQKSLNPVVFFPVPRHDSCPHGVSAIRTLCRWVSGSRHFEGTWKEDSSWSFHSEDGRKHCVPWNRREPQSPSTHRHVPEDLNPELHQLRKVTLITFLYVLFSLVINRFFHFAFFPTLCLSLLVGVICDPNKISDKLRRTATRTICVASLITAVLAIVTLPVLAGWSRTLPTPHEHLRCETSIECSLEAELLYAIRDKLLSVGVLEWPVCKQLDELLTCLDSTGVPVLLMNVALF